MASIGLILAIPTAGFAVLQSWFQGLILHGGRTRSITEAVVLFLGSSIILLWIGVTSGEVTGIYWGLASFTIAMFLQTLWLWFRSRSDERIARERDDFLTVTSPIASTTD